MPHSTLSISAICRTWLTRLVTQVSRIKERVEEKEGIPPVQQRLIFGGKQMSDDKTAEEYGLEGGATLHLVLALRGGSSR